MGSLVVSSGDGRLSDKDSYVMFHPADKRVPHMLIALRELPSLFLDVSVRGSSRNTVGHSRVLCCPCPCAVTGKIPRGFS